MFIMSRSFTPPSTLSKEEIRTIADVRRDIWTNAFYGMAGGSVGGLALHAVAHLTNKAGLTKLPLGRNTLFAAFFLGSACGSFTNATVAGKNQVHNLHPIFEVGAEKPGSTYQDAIERAQERARELNRLEHRRTLRKKGIEEPELDAVADDKFDDERKRLYRRVTNKVCAAR